MRALPCPEICRHSRFQRATQSFFSLCTALASFRVLSRVFQMHELPSLLQSARAGISKAPILEMHTPYSRAYEIAYGYIANTIIKNSADSDSPKYVSVFILSTLYSFTSLTL